MILIKIQFDEDKDIQIGHIENPESEFELKLKYIDDADADNTGITFSDGKKKFRIYLEKDKN